MAIADHVAILTHHALATAQPNRKKAGSPMQFYSVLAFPPTAADDLVALTKGVAPGGSLAGLKVSVRRNQQLDKPIPGVPADWFIIRASTQFPPYLADEGGNQLSQDSQQSDIRVKFYAGKKVRAAISAYYWPNEGGGVSFNLDGVMAVGDGERLSIGNTAIATAFAGYVDPNAVAAAPSDHSSAGDAGVPAKANGGDPFQQVTKSAAAAVNPFA
jgi:hypothetical protein